MISCAMSRLRDEVDREGEDIAVLRGEVGLRGETERRGGSEVLAILRAAVRPEEGERARRESF